MRTDRSKGLIFVISGMLLMTLDPVFIRLSGASGFETAFLFGLFTFVSMSVFTALKGKGGISGTLRTGGLPMIISGLIMGGSGTTLVLSVKHTLVANTMLIMSTTPVFSAVFSRILLKERTNTRTWAASAVSIFGIYIIARGSFGTGSLFGDGMAVLCTAFASLNYVMWRKYPHISRSMSVALGGLSIAAFSFLPAALSSLSLRTWLVMMAMGLLSAPFGRTFVSTSARYIPATEISLFAFLRTVLAPAAVWLIFAERPAQSSFYGGSVILFALITLTWVNYRREAAAKAL